MSLPKEEKLDFSPRYPALQCAMYPIKSMSPVSHCFSYAKVLVPVQASSTRPIPTPASLVKSHKPTCMGVQKYACALQDK